MEKINVAELLRNCPRGMKLDCTMYDNLYFDQVCDDDDCLYPIGCYTIADEIRTSINFTEFGGFNTHINSKCVIFPVGKTTWEEFVPPCKFKVGDRIVDKFRKHVGASSTQGVISEITDDKYIFTDSSYIFITNQDNWELVPNKFDITTLKPFESRVLVRGNDPLSEWKPAIFGVYRGDKHNSFYVVGGNCWKQCIPYEGNEHLMGTTNTCDKFYKTWN